MVESSESSLNSRPRRAAARRAWRAAGAVLNAPLLLPYLLTTSRETIRADMRRWNEVSRLRIGSELACLLTLLSLFREFRTLYRYRISRGNWPADLVMRLLSIFYPGAPALYIETEKVGSGLFIQHGFSTIIMARSIGRNCWINQQVTIGYRNDAHGQPTIGDNVFILAGAKVLGDITVGDNAIVGANAVVIKNVPPDCVVVGVPARIVRRNGVKVREEL